MLLVGALATVTAGWLFIRRGSLSVAGIASPEMPVHGDFDTFWRSARALLNGTDIYQTAAENPNLIPPLVTLLIAPLGLLDFLPAYDCLCSSPSRWWSPAC
jgi:alpha-1,2-mannosyltransferase